MSSAELLLAAVLIAAPVQAPLPEIEPESWPQLQAALHQIGVEWEILDPRETRFMFCRQDDLANDLRVLRRRYHLLKDAPRLADTRRLPPRSLACQCVDVNRAFRQQASEKEVFEADRSQDYRRVVQETDQLYDAWDAIRDATCEYYFINIRREALMRLRDQLGEESYQAGQWPPYLPTWRILVTPSIPRETSTRLANR